MNWRTFFALLARDACLAQLDVRVVLKGKRHRVGEGQPSPVESHRGGLVGRLRPGPGLRPEGRIPE